MKVQWQLIDVETGKKYVTIGDPFNFDEASFKDKLKKQYYGTSEGRSIKILNKENNDNGQKWKRNDSIRPGIFTRSR